MIAPTPIEMSLLLFGVHVAVHVDNSFSGTMNNCKCVGEMYIHVGCNMPIK